MARGKIVVETAQLIAAKNEVMGLADTYQTAYKKVYELVTALQNAWTGSDNLAYTSQIEGFADDFQRMEGLMRDYAHYLEKAAETYRATQEAIRSAAGNLSTGN